jgi:hypothetical protein
MKYMIWLVILGTLAGLGYSIWRLVRRWDERKRAAEARFASFMAQTMKPTAPKVDPVSAPAVKPVAVPAVAVKPVAAPAVDLGQQKLLFEAATKAGEAGEPALSIQLYARLIARYPEGPFSTQARAAVEAQKSRLARP